MIRYTKAGVSLPELLIAMGNLAIIIAICSLIYFTSWEKFRSTNAVSDVQNSAVIGMDRFSRDFRETKPTFINNKTLTATPKFIYFPSPRSSQGYFQRTASGDQDWKTWIIYYLYPDADNAGLFYLARKQLDGDLTVQPSPSEADNLDKAFIVARNIYDFQVSVTPLQGNKFVYEAELMAKKNYRGKDYSFHTNRTFNLSETVRQ